MLICILPAVWLKQFLEKSLDFHVSCGMMVITRAIRRQWLNYQAGTIMEAGVLIEKMRKRYSILKERTGSS